MEIWLDTINLETIRKAKDIGILFGVTTNPTILSQTDKSIEKTLEMILEIHQGPITVQVIADQAKEMIEQGKKLYKQFHQVIVKVPVTTVGLEAIKHLSSLGIPVMATVVLDCHQALLAALAGATYMAPYVSRIEKNGNDPREILNNTVQIYKNQKLPTKILAASIQHRDWIINLAMMGIHAVTLKDPIFYDFISTSEHTQHAVEQFAIDWAARKSGVNLIRG